MSSTAMTLSQNALEPFRIALGKANESFRMAIPSTIAKYMTPERITKVTLASLSRNPALLECTPESVLKSVMESVSLGLEPTGGVLGHAYLVPYRNKHTNKREAQLVVGYRGLIDLAQRSEKLLDIEAHVVHQNDVFNLEYGRDPKLTHKPCLNGDAGEIIGAYCVATLVGGRKHCEWMSIEEIKVIQGRSRARDSGPWQTDFEEMAKKTVVRRCAKYLPMSTELVRALEVEDGAENGEDLISVNTPLALVPAQVEQTPTKTSRIAAKAKANISKAENMNGEQPKESEPPPQSDEDDPHRWDNVGPAPIETEPEPGSRG